MNYEKLRAEALECKELSTTVRWPADEILELLDRIATLEAAPENPCAWCGRGFPTP